LLVSCPYANNQCAIGYAWRDLDCSAELNTHTDTHIDPNSHRDAYPAQ
jgi:hypothetical protein